MAANLPHLAPASTTVFPKICGVFNIRDIGMVFASDDHDKSLVLIADDTSELSSLSC